MTLQRCWLPLLSLAVCPAIAPSAAAQRLFRSDTALNITITTNLKSFTSERDSLKLAKHEAVLSYPDSGGAATKLLPVRLRARGHFRRQARNCQFPPILLDFKSSAVKGSLLNGLSRLKITTNCRPGNGEYEQYILQEYAIYRVYAALADPSFKTRLARITYRDTLGKMAPMTTWAFFTEDIDDLAHRTHRKVMKANGALFADLEQEPLARLSVFEYLIGNTDWSISGLHNIALLTDSMALNITALPYDFDWTGAVDARYAFPDSRLPIKRVTDRLYRGLCLSPALFTSTIDHFKAKHATIDSLLPAIPGLTPDRLKRTQGYFDDFWKRTTDPRSLQKEFASDCQKQGN
jgi:hypothetical protein